MEQNFELVYQISFRNDSFQNFKNIVLISFLKSQKRYFNSPNFSTIPERLLFTLIQDDNFQMKEIEAWEHVIKWGLVQNPELSSYPTSLVFKR
jgi:hypothetical protein